MHFSTLVLVPTAAGILASATPPEANIDGYRLIQTDNLDDVELNWFEPPQETSVSTSKLNARGNADCNDQATSDASSASLHCDGSNGADELVCSLLVNKLGGYQETEVPSSPRQVCISDHDSWCCTSWSVEVEGLTYGDLYRGAKRIYDECNQNGISGYLEQYKMDYGDACMHQCVSNRGTKC